MDASSFRKKLLEALDRQETAVQTRGTEEAAAAERPAFHVPAPLASLLASFPLHHLAHCSAGNSSAVSLC